MTEKRTKKPKVTQHQRIFNYMRSHRIITPMDAYEKLGVTKLSTRIGEMKTLGVWIGKEYADGRNRYGEKVRFMRYWLEGGEELWQKEECLLKP